MEICRRIKQDMVPVFLEPLSRGLFIAKRAEILVSGSCSSVPVATCGHLKLKL